MVDVFVLHRLQRANRSPGPGPQPAGRNSPGNPVTSMVSMNFILQSNLFLLSCPVKLNVNDFMYVFLFCFFYFTTVVPVIYTHICDPQNVRDKREKQR